MTSTDSPDLQQRVDELEKLLSDNQMERDLIESANHEWMEMVDAIRDPMFVHDEDCRIIRVNRAYARIAGKPADELIGRPYYEVFPVHDGPLDSCKSALHDGHEQCEEIEQDSGQFYESRSFPVIGADDSYRHSVHIMEDISERKRGELMLRRTNRILRTLSAGNVAMLHAEDETELMQGLCASLINEGGYCCAWIGIVKQDENGKRIEPSACDGFQNESGNMNPDIAGSLNCQQAMLRIVEQQEPVLISDVFEDAQWQGCRDVASRYGFRSMLAIPLILKDQTAGILSVYSDEPMRLDDGEMRLLTEMGGDLSYGISALRTQGQSLDLFERLEEALVKTIQTVSLTIEKRDPYTAGHQQRVTELAVAIAHKLGLEEEVIQGIRMGGLIHDIGKIYVPSEILSRPGRLTEVEFNLIKSHAQIGYDIVKDVEFSWPVAQMVYQHHERLDGSGYPRGLKNGEILKEARILAKALVEDAADAAARPAGRRREQFEITEVQVRHMEHDGEAPHIVVSVLGDEEDGAVTVF